jgi:hypothetical protein
MEHPHLMSTLSLGLGSRQSSYGSSLNQADSLPIAMAPLLPSCLKVETTNRFSSLVFRPVQPASSFDLELRTSNATAAAAVAAAGGSANNSGFQTPRKRSSLTGTERKTFYKLFTAMLKSNQLSASDKWERSADSKVSSKPSIAASSPEVEAAMLYENKTNDVIGATLRKGSSYSNDDGNDDGDNAVRWSLDVFDRERILVMNRALSSFSAFKFSAFTWHHIFLLLRRLVTVRSAIRS